MVGLGLGLGLGLVVGLGSYGEYVITLGGELLRERPELLIIIIQSNCIGMDGQTLNEWAAVKSTKQTFFYLSRCVSFT